MKYSNRNGFSLIEALATVAIIGIITFLALPNVVSARSDAEKSMAIARAEAVNMAVASMVQSVGFASAKNAWDGASGDVDAQYELLKSYLAYAPEELDDVSPDGYEILLPSGLAPPLTKATLNQSEGEVITNIIY